MEQTKQEKAEQEHLNFMINLATIAMVAENKISMEEEPQMFQEAKDC